jgi:DNA-binding transcriptional regulator WhiA
LRNLNVTYKEANWGQIIGGKRGMRAMRKKYAFELKKWRAKGMERSPVIGEGNAKRIKIPPTNEKLAELIGAYLGDGTLNKYQLRISGDCRYEGPYYEYLSKIIFELFGIYPSIYRESKRRNTLLLVLSSNKVCSFFKERLNIQYGDKIRNKTVIPPEIIKDNRFSLACLRSLIDTDGSISRRGKNGSQFCIQFTSHNKFLLKQVVKIGKKFDLFTFYDKTGAGTNNWRRIEKYFSLVGSSNLKHIVRFYLRKFKKKTIYRRDAPSFYKQDLYKELTLPFKILAS